MIRKRFSLLSIATTMTVLATACGVAAQSAPPARVPTDTVTPTATIHEPVATPPKPGPALADSAVAINPRIEDSNDYNFSPLIPFDGIRPVYNPEFVSASEATLDDQELVMGVAIDGEAKAYPITVLRSREMVNDELGGIPILVTW
jgi:hypothetical protein